MYFPSEIIKGPPHFCEKFLNKQKTGPGTFCSNLIYLILGGNSEYSNSMRYICIASKRDFYIMVILFDCPEKEEISNYEIWDIRQRF